jgi:hypothetical protein
MAETKSVTVYTTTYDPWEEGQDEPVKNGESTDVYPCGGDDDLSPAEQAAEVMQYVVEASNDPWRPGSWYSEEAYIHPYTGEREEKTYHLAGFTDNEQRVIWNAVKGA